MSSVSLVKSWFKPAAKTLAAISVHEKIAALDEAKFIYEVKMRDLRDRFDTEANRLHGEYLDAVLALHAEETE